MDTGVDGLVTALAAHHVAKDTVPKQDNATVGNPDKTDVLAQPLKRKSAMEEADISTAGANGLLVLPVVVVALELELKCIHVVMHQMKTRKLATSDRVVENSHGLLGVPAALRVTWEHNREQEKTSAHTSGSKKRPKLATQVQEIMELGHHGELALRHALVDTREELKFTLVEKLTITKHNLADLLDTTNNGLNGAPAHSHASAVSEVA